MENNTNYFNNKIALITGSTRGIGFSVANVLGRLGVKIIIHGQSDDSVRASIEKLNSLGFNVLGFKADFSDLSETETMVDQIIKEVGRVDFIVNNAVAAHSTPIGDITPQEYKKIMRVNVEAPFLLTQKLIPILKKQNFGRIIFISSTSGLYGRNGGSVYAASKSALVGLARSLAKELGPYNITSNVIAPGLIMTEGLKKLWETEKLAYMAKITPLRKLGQPENIASAVAYLVSEEASFITGSVLIIDGGISI